MVDRFAVAREGAASMSEGLQTDVRMIKGVGPQRAELLKKRGIHTLEDLSECLGAGRRDRPDGDERREQRGDGGPDGALPDYFRSSRSGSFLERGLAMRPRICPNRRGVK